MGRSAHLVSDSPQCRHCLVRRHPPKFFAPRWRTPTKHQPDWLRPPRNATPRRQRFDDVRGRVEIRDTYVQRILAAWAWPRSNDWSRNLELTCHRGL